MVDAVRTVLASEEDYAVAWTGAASVESIVARRTAIKPSEK